MYIDLLSMALKLSLRFKQTQILIISLRCDLAFGLYSERTSQLIALSLSFKSNKICFKYLQKSLLWYLYR
jgi:hypothetical protein